MLLPQTLQKIGQNLAIAWETGGETYIPLQKLRAACPCALCKGEPDAFGRSIFKTTPSKSINYELNGWEIIGGYGLQPKWADGHSSGIFTWNSLQQLGES